MDPHSDAFVVSLQNFRRLSPWYLLSPETRRYLDAVSKLRTTSLRNNHKRDCEMNVLERRKNTYGKLAPQTVDFKDLPPEIRNRIYECVLLVPTETLVIATPFKDEAMIMGDQPPLSKTCRLVRSELLPIFYSKGKFVAYIKDFEFFDLAAWTDTVPFSLISQVPTISINVKLLSRLKSANDLKHLMRIWSTVRFDKFHVHVHNCFPGRPPTAEEVDQRQLVVKAIETVEEAVRTGDFTDVGTPDFKAL